MANLLKETITLMEAHQLVPSDVIFIGSLDGYSCTWDEFTVLADRDYDSGYGSREVASDLIIVFKNKIRFERQEYDGSEWWGVVIPFKKPKEKKKIVTLFPRWGGSLGTEED